MKNHFNHKKSHSRPTRLTVFSLMDQFSEDDKKKIGALVGAVVVAAVVLIVVLIRGKQPATLVGPEQGKASSDPSYSFEQSEEEEESSSSKQGLFEVLGLGNEEKPGSEESVESSQLQAPSRLPEPEKTESAPSAVQSQSKRELNVIVQDGRRIDVSQADSSDTREGEEKPTEKIEDHQGQEQKTSESSSSSKPDPSRDKLTLDEELMATSPYQLQLKNNASAPYFNHPQRDISLYFGDDIPLSKQVFVQPAYRGFVVFDRHMLTLKDIDPEAIDEYLQHHYMDGSIIVEAVSYSKMEDIAANEALKSDSVELDGKLYAIYTSAVQPTAYEEIVSKMTDAPVTIELLKKSLVKGNEKKEWPVSKEDPKEEAEQIVEGLTKDPARVEWKYGLPLLSPSPSYLVDGKDYRTIRNKSAVTYQFNKRDVNGDGVDEYVLTAKVKDAKESSLSGYRAIFVPSRTGLYVQSVERDK